jgi:hypothetical protein
MRRVSSLRLRCASISATHEHGPVAQGIEQQPSKLKVAGSNPAGVANKSKTYLSLPFSVDTVPDWVVDTFAPDTFPARILRRPLSRASSVFRTASRFTGA